MHALATFVPVFLASVVECVEAWTVVVAVGLTRGWRAPLLGTAVATGLIVALIAIFGVTLIDRVNEDLFRVVVGTLLLLFGLRWLRKAILRFAGVVGIHDESAIYQREVEALSGEGARAARFDWVGFVTAGKTMLLEGLEITFLVITLGAQGNANLAVASLAAVTAFVVVGAAGFVARGPLSRVPENTLKWFVGLMLCSFGTFWVAEGFGVAWPGDAWSILALFGAWVVVTWMGIRLVTTSSPPRTTAGGPRSQPREVTS